MAKPITLKIDGELCSKANSRQLVSYGGKPRFIKSQKARDYEEQALWQIKSQLRKRRPFDQPICMEATIWYASKRPDLDPSLLMDVLEKAGVYTNDRLIHEQHLFKMFDKENPRCEVTIWLLDD